MVSDLAELPIQGIKIARRFISDNPTKTVDETILGVFLSIGKTLGLDVNAKGVEDEAQFNTLQQLGCKTYQGFYASEAVPLNVLEDWISTRSTVEFGEYPKT
ncbi:MAG: EAL domain-containing protein [Myxococcales bacterium]|nr:MAG: EAL domain-containing protein [Myxococcales bacterium]